jgi:hypothetical protein
LHAATIRSILGATVEVSLTMASFGRLMQVASRLTTCSPTGHARRTSKRTLGILFVPSLAIAGSILQNMQLVRDMLIAAVRSEFPQAKAMPGVVDPIEEPFIHARDVRSTASVLVLPIAPGEEIRCPSAVAVCAALRRRSHACLC